MQIKRPSAFAEGLLVPIHVETAPVATDRILRVELSAHSRRVFSERDFVVDLFCGAGGGSALTPGQIFDLEVIKRKYANMVDIITYDDLLRRLDNIISALKLRIEENKAEAED